MNWLKKARENGCLQALAIGLVVSFVVTLVSCGFCGFLLFRFFEGPTLPSDFCTTEDDLYQVLAANGEEWAEELAHRVSNFDMMVETPSGQLWLYGDKAGLGFYVRVVTVLRTKLLGKAGYLYSRTGELPALEAGDELKHLEGNVYCYVIADPAW